MAGNPLPVEQKPTEGEAGVSEKERENSIPRSLQVVEFNDDLDLLEDPDPLDSRNPRRWSRSKKTLLFVALMSSSLLADGGMTWGATLIVPQAKEWQIEVSKSATSMNYGILLQGFGGIFLLPFIEAYGRLPLWLWPQVIALFMALGATLSNDYDTFTAFRALQGLFGTVPQVIGLPIIHDMYTPREWTRMINIWGTTFLTGPFLFPALAGYIFDGSSWKVSFGVLTAFYGVSTVLVLLFGHETFYIKGQRTQVASRAQSLFAIGNTNLPKGKTLAYWTKTLLWFILKPPLLLTGFLTLVNFTWPIGISTTIDTFILAPPYLMDSVQGSSMRFAGVIGALCGYTIGYFFNERIFTSYRGTWRTEYRLHGIWIPAVSMTGGLLTYGLTLHFGKHWIGMAFGWVMVNLGMIASMVAITAYALEKYPNYSTCVSAIINMWRTCGGFSVAYFQPAWIERNGIGLVFGLQAAIVLVCAVVIIPTVMVLEGRKKGGQTV